MKESDFSVITSGLSVKKLLDATMLALKKNQQDIKDLQQEQLDQGIDETGSRITPGYTPFTIRKKKEKGQPFDRVTLHDTGDFQKSIFTKFAKDHFQVDAKDWKTNHLKRKYDKGGKLLGLTKNNKLSLAKWIKPDIQEEFKKNVLEQTRANKSK